MMKKLIAIIFCCLALPLYAQTNDLTDDEINAFKVQCLERIDAFQMGLEIIADKQQDITVRNHYISTLPEMFMGDGNPWTDLNGQHHSAPKMQVAVIRYNKVIETRESPIKEYLNHLKQLKWKSIKIKKAQTCRISNFYKVSNQRYEATATFFQYFEGSNGEGQVYRDKTQKEVKIYLTRVEDGQLGTYWDLRFGDVNVSEISQI